MSDPIGDMLTRIRNGFLASNRQVTLPYAQLKAELAQILLDQGYLKEVKVVEERRKKLLLSLAYQGKKPTLVKIQRLSKPGRRVYLKASAIKPVLSGLGCLIISTPQGLMTGKQARRKNLGGEAICRLW